MKYDKGAFAAYAKADLEQMECNAKNGFFPALSTCMHAQQYAEKMLKEKIVELFGTEPEKTHNLKTLLGTILPSDYEVDPDLVLKASILSNYYMASRYPDFGGLDDITEDTAESAYQWSKEIVDFIDKIYKDDDGLIRIDIEETTDDD